MLSFREIVSKEIERNDIFSDFSLILNVFSMSWRLYRDICIDIDIDIDIKKYLLLQ